MEQKNLVAITAIKIDLHLFTSYSLPENYLFFW